MKKISILLALVYPFFVTTSAQTLNADEFIQIINKEKAYKHLSILASDRFEGRGTGTKGGRLAANYLKRQFKLSGLIGPVQTKYFQQLNFVYDQPYLTMNVDGVAMKPNKDFRLSKQHLPISILLDHTTIYFAGYNFAIKGREAYDNLELSGKVIVTFKYSQAELINKLKYFVSKNVSAILVIDKSLDNINDEFAKSSYGYKRLRLEGKNYTDAPLKGESLYINIGTAAANILFSKQNWSVNSLEKAVTGFYAPLIQKFKTPVRANLKTIVRSIKAENVLGYLEGSDPILKNELVVISSHYDHIGGTKSKDGVDRIANGADDDGSGTTGVLLLAEAFMKARKAGRGPKRSMLFITYTGEEMGLLGSTYYTDHPVFPLENTIANLNMDMIGRGEEKRAGDNNYIYTIGAGLISSELDSISKKVNADHVGLRLEVGVDGNPRSYYTASDHYNFAKHGIPVIFYFNGVHEDYHKPSDEIDKIDFDALAKRVKLVYYTAWELANRPNRLRIDRE